MSSLYQPERFLLSWDHFTDAEFCKFLDHPSMLDVKERSVFVHVDLPGQEDYAPDLPEEYVSPF
jgi:hypothetical protein